MRGTTGGLHRALPIAAMLAAASWSGATAFEFHDGRLQVHGFGEIQIRGIARNYSYGDDFDLTQWYWVLNTEIEYDILEEPIGPVDLVSGFARIEVRYDCVWTRGCGLMRQANTFGDRAERVPKRLGDAEFLGFDGQISNGDTRRRMGIPLSRTGFAFRNEPDRPFSINGGRPVDVDNDTAGPWNVTGISTLFGIEGVDGLLGTPDDPAFTVFEKILGYKFAMREIRGSSNGNGIQTLGPWLPENDIQSVGTLRNVPNPFNSNDPNLRVLTDPTQPQSGTAELPFRPAPLFQAAGEAPGAAAQGIFYPSRSLRRVIRKGDLDAFDQNFRQAELEWNRGASQQDEKELKELYFDIEMFDARLWMRLGKQSIVWGKTELFRTTDQLNPQDLALASLPSLEESRISLWAARFVYSFYEVGPLEDVRLELAFNFDQFEPADIGRCGEPYTPNLVCDKTFGLFVHGLAGIALAGEERPPAPWNGFQGWEGGVRLEWRWDRFSFALIDFYGFNDTPFTDVITRYSRDVDARTGRPRSLNATGGCDPDGLFDGDTSGCLGVAPFTFGRLPSGQLDINPSQRVDVLDNSPMNIQVFALICGSSVGFSGLDRSSCGQSVFNSQRQANPALNFGVASALTLMMGGENQGFQNGALVFSLLAGIPQPRAAQILVPLNRDPNDGPNTFIPGFTGSSLAGRLTDEQEALLGCGRFYGTNCDLDGIDLLNAEASVILQSFPGFEGTPIVGARTDQGIQPGTRDFRGGPIATRVDRAGRLVTLPGARSPFAGPGDLDGGYDPNVDGCVGSAGALGLVAALPECAGARTLAHPIVAIESGGAAPPQFFRSELAALSYNLLMVLVVQSGSPSDVSATSWDGELLPSQGGAPRTVTDPFNPGIRCSFVTPQWCSSVTAFYSISGVRRNDRRAEGNGEFGRRDFLWHGGAEAVLTYEKRNVAGFSMDFAEDTTGTNWGLEATWVEGLPSTDADELDRIRRVDQYNLTVSVDRPTWINFLNESRTFFFNSQWFFQYLDGYRESSPGNGPFNVLMTLTAQTGYSQDRLLPGITFVYDFESGSGAGLPTIQYLFSANFSATFGFGIFWGRWQEKDAAITPFSLPNRVGKGAYSSFEENGLAVVRDRDEIFLRIRYTF